MTDKPDASIELEGEAAGFIERLNTALDKVGEVVNKHGEEAADLTLSAIQMHGILMLIFGVMGLGFLFGGVVLLWWFVRKIDEVPEDDEPRYVFGAIGSAIVGFGSLIGALATLLDPHNIMAAFAPELALAYKMMDGVLM